MELISRIVGLCPDARFTIVGGNCSEIESWKAETAGQANIHFAGHVPHGEVARYIAAFDVVLLPNQNTVSSSRGTGSIGAWTSPLKMFEYMAAGKPIVASDLPVLREVLHDGESALLCSPDDPKRWAATIATLHRDPELRQRLGAQ